MLSAYLRRKAWEHRTLAVAIVNLLGEALGGSGSKGTSGGYQEIPTGAMFDKLGLK